MPCQNIYISYLARAPVLLVTDNLDSVPGALSYLEEDERERVKGVILNKFRIDDFLAMGIKEKYIKLGIKRIKSVYQEKIGKDILGVIPYLSKLAELPDLDPLIPSPKVPFDIWKKQ